jgi:hypothetical protein
MATFVIASKGERDLVCDTGDLNYVPDPVRYRYGSTSRRPYEDWFLTLFDFIKSRFPEHEIFTLGNSLVIGEKFVTYFTICELELRPESFENLRQAVRDSDQAIRRRVAPMWEWGCCLIGPDRNKAALIIGWHDFAYFVQHRGDFLDRRHNRFMAAFAPRDSQSTDYKVLHDGTIVEFDPLQLREDERQVFERPSEIRFEEVQRARDEQRMPLAMV